MKNIKINNITLKEISSDEELKQINGGGNIKDVIDYVVKVIHSEESNKKGN